MGIQSLPPNAGTSRIKKRIRDLERLLAKPGLAATKKSEAERAVAAFKVELSTAQHKKVEIKNSKKYHMVKFVEKKKSLRNLRKKTASDKELAAYYYILLYPRDKKYRALYAGETPATGETHPFLKEIQNRMDSGDLERGPETISKIITSS